MKKVFFLFSCIFNILVCVNIYRDLYRPLFLFFWVLSIAFLIASFLWKENIRCPKMKLGSLPVIAAFFILLPVIVRVANYHLFRAHGDEILTAYFSATTSFTKINFFSGIPSDKAQWVAQFPTMFFALQKIFFKIFGESYLTIKLSILPYVFIISLITYRITARIFSKPVALIAVVFYAYFAISLYLETLGLHFVSSTAAFMIFFYFLMQYIYNQKSIYAVFMGISAGFCFLFYITSYIALPFMIIFYLFCFFRRRKKTVFLQSLLSLFAFVIVLSPYITYAFKYDNYFVSRTSQVSLFRGSWSGNKEKIEKGVATPPQILWENIQGSIKSLYMHGVGGHGGYTFANQAFFEKVGLLFVIAGSIISLLLIFRKVEIFFVWLSILSTFATMVLAIPPPAFQRFTISFPFWAIIMSFPFGILFHVFAKRKNLLHIAYVLSGIILFSYCLNNEFYFLSSVKTEQVNESIMISNFINQNYPNRKIYVASYPGFGFDKVYYFSKGKNAASIETGYHKELMDVFNPNEKYLYAFIFPYDFKQQFAHLDPNGKVIPISTGYHLFVN